MEYVCISLGSNVGDKAKNIISAYEHIIALEGIYSSKFSRLYETSPVGGPLQPLFLNAAMCIETELSPALLLRQVQDIETALGRIRTIKWGPRTIDIDILLYGSKIIHDEQLTIPHPLMHKRMFVLEPLSEIAPDIVHPVLKKTVFQLYKELQTSLVTP
jgi:2-amino-4-hydroxy-6-hydroxymethyldihydropteridine diphosphokinase